MLIHMLVRTFCTFLGELCIINILLENNLAFIYKKPWYVNQFLGIYHREIMWNMEKTLRVKIFVPYNVAYNSEKSETD